MGTYLARSGKTVEVKRGKAAERPQGTSMRSIDDLERRFGFTRDITRQQCSLYKRRASLRYGAERSPA